MGILLSDGGWSCQPTGACWDLSSSSPSYLALLSRPQRRTEGPGQGTEAVGAEDGGGLRGTCPHRQGWLSLLPPICCLAQTEAVEARDELG